MNFACGVDINASREKVIALFDNPNNMKHWQDGFVSFKNISGEKGTVGSESIITYNIKNREIELIETVVVRDLPREFTGNYVFKEGANSMRNLFKEITPQKTRYTAEVNYYEINSFIMKLMSWFFPGIFKKQVQKWMNQFKDFVEKHPD